MALIKGKVPPGAGTLKFIHYFLSIHQHFLKIPLKSAPKVFSCFTNSQMGLSHNLLGGGEMLKLGVGLKCFERVQAEEF